MPTANFKFGAKQFFPINDEKPTHGALQSSARFRGPHFRSARCATIFRDENRLDALGNELVSGLNEMVVKFEDSLTKYNINTTECMQKALCTYIESTERVKEKSGINNFVDGSLNALTKYVPQKLYRKGAVPR